MTEKPDHDAKEEEFNADPNWDVACEVCEMLPTVGDIGLCGPCCFGEAETMGGNW